MGCEPDEEPYEIVEMLKPIGRRTRMIPPESQLCVILNKR